MSEADRKECSLDYAGPSTPVPQTTPESFRLDLDARRNLRPIILFGVVFAIVVVAFVVAHLLV